MPSKAQQPLLSAFPWFGGKRLVAPVVWRAFGDVRNYVEPFFGSGAVLLGRPECNVPHTETINDKDGFVANFWRAVKAEPDATAHWADNPVNENDLHARHAYLVHLRDELSARLEGDPLYYDPLLAGWWCWGICSWIGSGFCSGSGPWHVVDGLLVRGTRDAAGVNRQLPHLGNGGTGVNRQLPHMGNAGRGVHRRPTEPIAAYFHRLASRLRRVRVACGDWARVCTPAVTTRHGLTGVLLDPPYSSAADRTGDLYAADDLSVAHRVRDWAIANGDDPKMRIALCGYAGEHEMPATWTEHAWSARGGYGNEGSGNLNRHRERIWFSPHCLPIADLPQLFAERDATVPGSPESLRATAQIVNAL